MTQAVSHSCYVQWNDSQLMAHQVTLISADEFMSYQASLIDNNGQVHWSEGKHFTGVCKSAQVIYVPFFQGIKQMEFNVSITLRGDSIGIPENPEVKMAFIPAGNLNEQHLISDWELSK